MKTSVVVMAVAAVTLVASVATLVLKPAAPDTGPVLRPDDAKVLAHGELL